MYTPSSNFKIIQQSMLYHSYFTNEEIVVRQLEICSRPYRGEVGSRNLFYLILNVIGMPPIGRHVVLPYVCDPQVKFTA